MPSAAYRKQKQDSANRVRLGVVLLLVLLVVGIIVLANVSRLNPLPDYAFAPREQGSTTAKLIVEEFADYQCPYCGVTAFQIQPALMAKYVQTGKVRFIFRNFPFIDQNDPNQESHSAALAALCAGDQNLFWQYHDLLFKNQTGENKGDFIRTNLISFAMQLNMDSVAFNQCLTSNKYAALVDSDIERGKRLNVNSTPSFFINGNPVVIGQDLQNDLFKAIDRALSASGS